MNDLFDDLGFDIKKIDALKEKKEQSTDTKEAIEKKALNKLLESIFDKSYNCPVCKNTFSEKTVKTHKIQMIGSDDDLRPIYGGIDPLLYDVILCGFCGYAALRTVFSKLIPVQAEFIKRDISHQFLDNPVYTTEPLYDYEFAIKRYKLALLNAYVKKAKESEKAYICLKMAWLYRVLGDVENEKKMIAASYQGFNIVLEKERFPIFGMDELTLSFILAVHARMLGIYDESLKRLSKIIVNPQTKPRLKERARDQKEIIRKERDATKDKTTEVNIDSSLFPTQTPSATTNTPKIEHLYYGDGSIMYEGELYRGKPHGKGKEFFPNGNLKTEGQFKNGKKHGHCKVYWMNGQSGYEGVFENDSPKDKAKCE